jgi:hypothetical protein
VVECADAIITAATTGATVNLNRKPGRPSSLSEADVRRLLHGYQTKDANPGTV